MDEHLLDIYAHLNLCESLLEILYANVFRDTPNPDAQLERFRLDLRDRFHRRAFPPPHTQIVDGVIYDHCVEVAERFCGKVARRMREQAAQEDQTTQ